MRPAGADRASVLCASSIAPITEALSAALEAASGLGDAERIEAIGALEDLTRVATAAQAALARELDASQRSEQAAAGIPAELRGRGVALQVALARRESHHRGRRHLALATVLPDELPHTWAAWRAGRITEYTATLVARETACLPLAHRREVDRLVAADTEALDRMGDRELAAACAKHAARLDPASVVARRRRAEQERCVTLRPAPDTMSYLTALLPAKDGVAVLKALTDAADAARAAAADPNHPKHPADPEHPADPGTKDERTKGQVMADTLVSRVLTGAEAAGGPRVELGLVMTDAALLGSSDDPAHLEAFGPVPAELGREIVAGACTRGEEVWLRRLYTSPLTGELVAMEATGRAFRGGLARFIRLRDQVCRTPWCSAPVRHLDHATSADRGGPTSAANGQGLCEACNYAKEAPGWEAGPRPDGSIETLTPTGHRHTTRPPPVVTVRRRALPPITIDYVLAV